MSKSLSILQTVMIVITSAGLWNHVILIPIMLDVADRDAWFAIVLAVPPFLLWIVVLFWIIKKSNQQPLLEWVSMIAGKGVSVFFRVILAASVFVIAIITVKDTVNWAAASYLPETPVTILSVLLVLLCYFAARSGITSIAVSNGILLPFIILFGYFVMSANLPNKDYTRLLPVMANGTEPVLMGVMYACTGFGELMLILLIQHHIKAKIKLWQLLVLGIFVAGLALGPITGSLAEFGPVEAAKHRYPAFEQWKLVTISRYIERVDFFSIYQWFAGAFVRVSMAMYVLGELSPFKGKTHKSIFLMLVSVLLIVINLMPISDIQFYNWLKYQCLPATFVGYLLLTIALCIIGLFVKKGGRMRGKLE